MPCMVNQMRFKHIYSTFQSMSVQTHRSLMLIDFNCAKIWTHPNRPPLAAFTCTTVSRHRVKTQLLRTDHKWVLSSQMTDVMTDDWCDGYMTDVRAKEGHRQSNEHWNRFKGDVGEISERWGGARTGFFERTDTNLNCEDRRLIWWQVIGNDCIIMWGQMTDTMTFYWLISCVFWVSCLIIQEYKSAVGQMTFFECILTWLPWNWKSDALHWWFCNRWFYSTSHSLHPPTSSSQSL